MELIYILLKKITIEILELYITILKLNIWIFECLYKYIYFSIDLSIVNSFGFIVIFDLFIFNIISY